MARLEERFAIRGRSGAAELTDPVRAGGAITINFDEESVLERLGGYDERYRRAQDCFESVLAALPAPVGLGRAVGQGR